MVNLKDYLIAHGASNLTGWTLTAAQGISANGNTIVGYGRNPAGQSEAWIATVPEQCRTRPYGAADIRFDGLQALAVDAASDGVLESVNAVVGNIHRTAGSRRGNDPLERAGPVGPCVGRTSGSIVTSSIQASP